VRAFERKTLCLVCKFPPGPHPCPSPKGRGDQYERGAACGLAPIALITIAITNRQKTLPIDRRRMRRVVRQILKDAEIAEARISIAIVDDATIAKLHEQFLDDPGPTDVLSFVLEQSPQMLEGEVVASADTAVAYAPTYKCSAEEELLRYVIHGSLHLVGYDDTTPKKRAVMRKMESKYLVSVAENP
jgi:probable rRNA maturation factor